MVLTDYRHCKSGLYAILEEEIYMMISRGMAKVFEEHYMNEDILTQIKSIYGLVQALYF